MAKSRINGAILLAISFVIIGCCSASGPFHAFGPDFGYDGEIGPSNDWADVSVCHGKYKIPLNTDNITIAKQRFAYLNMSGFEEPAESAELINIGETILFNLTFNEAPTIEGGPLKTKEVYKFAHLNFQWKDVFLMEANKNMTGELHVVFYNARYFSLSEALKYSGGIAVMAFPYMINDNENDNYKELVALLPQVSEPNMRSTFIKPPKLKDLTVRHPYFYIAYNGSLVTQPCSKDVIWMDFHEAIPISTMQYNELGKYFKQEEVKQNPEFNAFIYKLGVGSLPPKNLSDQEPVFQINNRANAHNFIAIERWFILLILEILK